MSHPDLVAEARGLQAALKPAWGRVEGLLQDVRCMGTVYKSEATDE